MATESAQPDRQIGAPPMVARIRPREDLKSISHRADSVRHGSRIPEARSRLRQILRTPSACWKFPCPPKMGQRPGEVFTGYRVQAQCVARAR